MFYLLVLKEVERVHKIASMNPALSNSIICTTICTHLQSFYHSYHDLAQGRHFDLAQGRHFPNSGKRGWIEPRWLQVRAPLSLSLSLSPSLSLARSLFLPLSPFLALFPSLPLPLSLSL